MASYRAIEVRGFKWPRRATSVAMACFLGEDSFGCWLGIKQGNPWWKADRSQSGVFDQSFVKLAPHETYWTACFNPTNNLVDVDIVLPVRWTGDVLEEVDLELDVLRTGDDQVLVRDEEEFHKVRKEWAMPDDIACRAQEACAQLHSLVKQRAEPFGVVGQRWLSQFLAAR